MSRLINSIQLNTQLNPPKHPIWGSIQSNWTSIGPQLTQTSIGGLDWSNWTPRLTQLGVRDPPIGPPGTPIGTPPQLKKPPNPKVGISKRDSLWLLSKNAFSCWKYPLGPQFGPFQLKSLWLLCGLRFGTPNWANWGSIGPPIGVWGGPIGPPPGLGQLGGPIGPIEPPDWGFGGQLTPRDPIQLNWARINQFQLKLTQIVILNSLNWGYSRKDKRVESVVESTLESISVRESLLGD